MTNDTSKPGMIHSIILADDDRDDSELFHDVLLQVDSKIKLQVVNDGIELISLLKHIYPDILFLDLEMPRKNGLECLIEIRKDPVLKPLPVVVFSSTTRPANIQTAYEMGAHLFLIKSPSFAEYTASIKAILSLDWKSPDHVREQYCINGRYTAFI
jgi:CheY-like chemotaxis protein